MTLFLRVIGEMRVYLLDDWALWLGPGCGWGALVAVHKCPGSNIYSRWQRDCLAAIKEI